MTYKHASANLECPRGCRASVNRRDFITVAGLLAAALSSGVLPMSFLATAGAAPPSALPSDSETYRPQFHFTPSQGWMNDPCGMFYHDGDYHLHYQWNPDLGGWGKHWAQVVSRDLVHWTPWPVSLSKDPVLGECWPPRRMEPTGRLRVR
jgi:hypothetical protein